MDEAAPRVSVIDSSALLAEVFGEPGADVVVRSLPGSVMSTVNWSEVAQKSSLRGLRTRPLRLRVQLGGLTLIPFSSQHAETAAALWPQASRYGISLADRACMALAIELGATIITANRRWAELDLPVPVEAIR